MAIRIHAKDVVPGDIVQRKSYWGDLTMVHRAKVRTRELTSSEKSVIFTCELLENLVPRIRSQFTFRAKTDDLLLVERRLL